jgi:hypothetical protein
MCTSIWKCSNPRSYFSPKEILPIWVNFNSKSAFLGTFCLNRKKNPKFLGQNNLVIFSVISSANNNKQLFESKFFSPRFLFWFGVSGPFSLEPNHIQCHILNIVSLMLFMTLTRTTFLATKHVVRIFALMDRNIYKQLDNRKRNYNKKSG